jgi:hypothetical protein
MGRWGTGPLDNDAAAYWLANLLEQTDLVRRVHDTLRLDVVEYGDEIRAAASVLASLAHAQCWPGDQMEASVGLALTRLREMVDRGVVPPRDPLFEAVEEQIAHLAAALGVDRIRV